jgi:hypothetical protein
LKSELTSALALLTGVWLTGFLALTIRLLPLLSGLLAATLLLAGLLTRVLVLLARVLFLAGHSGISLLLTLDRDNRQERLWFQRNLGSAAIIARRWRGRGPDDPMTIPWRSIGDLWRGPSAGTRAKTTLYNPR